MKIVQTAGRDSLGEFAPDFAHLNDDVLFGEVWNNTDIDLKTRSIITVVALMSSGITDSSLKYHLQNAKNHGVTQKEIAAIITHVAFYVGWPKGWAIFNMAKEIWDIQGELPQRPVSEYKRVPNPATEMLNRQSEQSAASSVEKNPGKMSDAELLQKILMAQMAKKTGNNAAAGAGQNAAGASGNGHVCPVCGKHVFANENAKSVCPECGWQNDLMMEAAPDSGMGDANDCCLNEFRARYKGLKQVNPAYSYRKDGLPL